MIKYNILAGSVDQSVVIRIIDSTDGTPETGVVWNTSGIDLQYRRELAASTAITEATLAALTTAHADGGFLHIGNGYYRLDLPDAAVAAGASGCLVHGVVTGMVVIGCYIDLTAVPVDVRQWIGTAAATPTVAGVPEVDVTHFNGTAGTFAAGIPAVNAAQISGDSTAADNLELAFDDTAGAVPHMGIIDQGTAQSATSTTLVLRAAAAFADDQLIGAVIVITGGSAGVGQSRQITDYVSSTDTATVAAWTTTPTGTITYKILASPPFTVDTDVALILADTNDIQTRIPAALVSGRMDASVGAMAANVVTAAATAADFTTEVTAGLATAAALDTIDNLLDTEVATIMADLDDIQARLPAALVGGRIDANAGAISGDAAAADNLETALDDTAGAVPWLGIIDQGTAQAATGTTLQLRAAASFADDTPIGATLMAFGSTQGYWQSRQVTDYVSATDTATVDAWTVTPSGTITYKLFAATPAATTPMAVNVTQIGGDAQSATDLKDFADAGYDPATNKVQGVVLVDTVTTYTGNTPQTGDAFARLGAPAGASIAADILILDNFIDTEVGAIKAVTDALPNAGALTTIQGDLDDIQTRLPAALVSGRMDSNVAAISDDATAADNAEAFFDGTGYAGTNNVIPTVTVVNGLAANVVNASALDAGAVTEIQSGLATAAAVAAVGNFIDTEIADIQSRLPAALVGGRIDANVGAVSGDSVAADNLEIAFDDTPGPVPHVGIVDQGTAQAATGTSLQLRAGAAFADDELNGAWVQIVSASAGAGQTRRITDYVSATDTATVDAWTTTPTGTIVYKVWRAARLDANITHVINDAVQASSSKDTSWGGTP